MPLFTIFNISSGVLGMCLLIVSSKDHLLYHFENAHFEWKQKHAVFVHVSLNTNEQLPATLIFRIGLCLNSIKTSVWI